MLSVVFSFAATLVQGRVTDEANEPIIGANVSIKGTTEGTVTDLDGNFELTTEQETPFTLVISMVGMVSQEQEITGDANDLVFTLSEESNELNTVVVSASRVEEKILESPVTIEKMDQKAVKLSSSSDYYDDLSKLKGVQVIQGSMTLTSVNTRGFGGISNTRFVQLMDGMDNAAPLLNFPTGNIVGIGELDISNVELVPGAASALYGPNAFNGILLMNSKNPFDYPGFSAQVKGGFSQAGNNYGYKPMGSVGMRVGHVWKRKEKEFVAIKFNFNAFKGTDWYANDYTTARNNSGALGTQGFDGMNLYGDEANIFELSPLALPSAVAGAESGTNSIVGGINYIKAQVTAAVRAGAYAQAYAAAIGSGLYTPEEAAAIANTQADAYVASPTGQATINAGVQAQVAANIPVPISDPNYTANMDAGCNSSV
ncbi:MAG: carboxypeptidase-like regulatory domain-containing protein [Chitinophagales bacterium]